MPRPRRVLVIAREPNVSSALLEALREDSYELLSIDALLEAQRCGASIELGAVLVIAENDSPAATLLSELEGRFPLGGVPALFLVAVALAQPHPSTRVVSVLTIPAGREELQTSLLAALAAHILN